MAWCMHCLESKSFFAPACPHCTQETGFWLNFLFQIIGGIAYVGGMILGGFMLYWGFNLLIYLLGG